MPELQYRGQADPAFPGAVRVGGAVREQPVLPRPPAWTEQAACLGMDVNLFFPGDRGSVSGEAQRTCSGCPVRTQCGEWATDRDEEHGVFGGMTPRERHQLRPEAAPRRRQRHAPAGRRGNGVAA